MVKTENVIINEKVYVKSWSDAGFYIHGGNPVEHDYITAIDTVTGWPGYTETDIPLPTQADEEIPDSEALKIITGEGGGEQ